MIAVQELLLSVQQRHTRWWSPGQRTVAWWWIFIEERNVSYIIRLSLEGPGLTDGIGLNGGTYVVIE